MHLTHSIIRSSIVSRSNVVNNGCTGYTVGLCTVALCTVFHMTCKSGKRDFGQKLRSVGPDPRLGVTLVVEKGTIEFLGQGFLLVLSSDYIPTTPFSHNS